MLGLCWHMHGQCAWSTCIADVHSAGCTQVSNCHINMPQCVVSSPGRICDSGVSICLETCAHIWCRNKHNKRMHGVCMGLCLRPWCPQTKSIGDLSTFLSSTGPQVSIGVQYVSIRAWKQNFLPNLFFGASSLAKNVLTDANTKIKTVQPYTATKESLERQQKRHYCCKR